MSRSPNEGTVRTIMRPTTRTLGLLLAAAGAAACSSDPWDDPTTGDPFVPEPRLARRVGRILEDGSPRLAEGIGGTSVAGGDRTLWLIGDARVGSRRNGYSSPCVVLSAETADWPGSEGVEIVRAAAPESVPPPEDRHRRWLSGVTVTNTDAPAGDVVLHYAITRPGEPGEPALDYHGAGVARLSAGGLRIATRDDGDWRFFGRGDPVFGMAIVQAGHGITTGWDHVYGIRGDAGTRRVYVARVPHGRGDEPSAYRYHSSDGGWSTDVRAAAPLFRAGPQGMSVSWNGHLQAFLAVYAWTVPSADGDPPRIRVLARAARQPEGPWSRETVLFETRGPPVAGRVRPDAGAREHPQLALDGGRVLFVSLDGGGSAAPAMWRLELPERR